MLVSLIISLIFNLYLLVFNIHTINSWSKMYDNLNDDWADHCKMINDIWTDHCKNIIKNKEDEK